MTSDTYSIVVLVSGGGTNLQAMIDAIDAGDLPVRISGVISNAPEAYALKRAARAGISCKTIDHRTFKSREAFDAQLLSTIDALNPDLVVMAGFMRILSESFFKNARVPMINVHPSLLPLYTGLDTHARAIADGARFHGASVHFVTPELDAGPVIVRGAVPVKADDSVDTLQQRVHGEEYRIYPLAIRWLAQGRLSIVDNKVLLDGVESPEQGLGNPESG